MKIDQPEDRRPIGAVGSAAHARGAASARADRRPSPLVATGRAVGGAVVTGVGRFIASEQDLDAFRPGEILLAEHTLPQWRAVMSGAAAIVTNRGGRTSHAAIMARKLGVPAIVGTIDGASRLWTGATLTVACAEDGVGRVYEGAMAPHLVG